MAESIVNVRVALADRSYDIAIGSGILSETAARLQQVARVSHAVILFDEHVRAWADVVASSCRAASMRTDEIAIPPGEASKSMGQADRLLQRLLEHGADRKSFVMAVGGGVIGDLAGFVAATYARGLAFCQIPTSLLAMVDSSVGGKTGINLPTAKNMVGVFWQPALVMIDTATLATLPEREYLSGLAEVVKYGVILDADFFATLEQQVKALRRRDQGVLRDVIGRCCQLKAQVVAADERETTGLRAVLNYGHTFAHAIEAIGGYGALLHGEAVSIGMICASRLAERLGRIDRATTERQSQLLEALGLPVRLPELSNEALWQAMQHDKKVEHGRLRFVLPTRLGQVELVPDVGIDAVMPVLTECQR